MITSRKNQELKFVNSLKDKKFRDKYGLYLVEGEKLVADAVKYAEVLKIFGEEEKLSQYSLSGIELVAVSKEIANYISDSVSPQGIVAIVKKPENRLIAPLFNSILLDNIQDPGNFGTILRTAVAVGIKDIYAINSADAFSPKTVRASMSGIFNVEIHSGDYEQILPLISNQNIICADMHGQDVFSFPKQKNFCLAIGSEGNGLSNAVKNLAKFTVKIPMSDKMESLNAGVSASILLYQLIY